MLSSTQAHWICGREPGFTGSVIIGEWVYSLKRADPGKILLISGNQNAAMNYSSGRNNSIREFYPVHTTQINFVG